MSEKSKGHGNRKHLQVLVAPTEQNYLKTTQLMF